MRGARLVRTEGGVTMPQRSRPVVLLHGCGGTAHATFEATGMIGALKRAGRKPIALTLPGHGPTPRLRNAADFADLAGTVARELPAGRFDAVGYSLGAKILLELAFRMPARIGRMVLGAVGDNVFAPETVAEAAARALDEGVTPDTPPAVLAFLKTWDPTRNHAAVVAAVLRRSPNPVFSEVRLRAITTPILLVNGDADPATRVSDRLRASLPNVRLTMLPGVDHFGLTKQPEFVHAAVDFLAPKRADVRAHAESRA